MTPLDEILIGVALRGLTLLDDALARGQRLLDDFLVRAALGGMGAALAAGPLGCFVLWRRMAYFGDAAAHAALLGVAVSLALELPIAPGVFVAAAAMALFVAQASGSAYAADSMLGVAAHSALAFGLIGFTFMPWVRVDLMGYLFGDILAVSRNDLALVWGGAALVLALLAWRWNALLTATLDPDLAAAEGGSPAREQLILTLALAALVALALKIVGALLITALLILPPAAARALARTPEEMAVGAALMGMASAALGLWASLLWDFPAGPAIVAAATLLFTLTAAARGAMRRRALRKS